MTIKEVSEKYGITQDTLRYYEKAKMIPAVTRTKGGIRDYQEEDLKWVELAICMRNAGLPIEVMIEYLNLFQKLYENRWNTRGKASCGMYFLRSVCACMSSGN